MREDMFKVLVERPRRLSGDPPVLSKDGRRFRNRVWPDEDGGQAPHRLGMKAGYGHPKYLNENLAPLGRWLASQVNRPWNKVYAELCAHIDRRNTVQQHIFVHMGDFVALNTFLDDGVVMVRTSAWAGYCVPIDQAQQDMFVHPRTGILLANRARLRRRQAERARQDRASAASAGRLRVLGENRLCMRIEDAWFLVDIAPLPEGVPSRKPGENGRPELHFESRWDVVRKTMVSRGQQWRGPVPAYGKRGWYAVAKRQMSAIEIRRHGLDGIAGRSRPCSPAGA